MKGNDKRFRPILGQPSTHTEGSAWMTKSEAQEYLGIPPLALDELIRTGQVDTVGSSTNAFLLRKSVVTYRRLREQIG